MATLFTQSRKNCKPAFITKAVPWLRIHQKRTRGCKDPLRLNRIVLDRYQACEDRLCSKIKNMQLMPSYNENDSRKV